MATPVFYSFRRCPYAMRARLALQVSGVSVQLREVVLRDKPASLLKASSKGTVPVLIDADERVIDESLDIMQWALRKSDPAFWLSPSQGSLAAMCELVARCESDFKVHLDRYKYTTRYEGADSLEHRALAADFLHGLDARLQATPWLFGARASLADAAIAPFVRQFANADRAWFDAQPWSALRSWLEDFLDAPLFAAIMSKYAPWQMGDSGHRFPETHERMWQRRS